MKEATPETLKSKQHFEMLDGLRGIAALSVVSFHFMEVAIADYSNNFIGHGFLAVDFFFCLSGFVIAYAYDNRIGQMGVTAFFKARVMRLHPLVILGSALGLLTFFFDPFGGHPESYGAGKILLIFLCSICLIPYPVMPDRYFNLFGLNAPSWSLFWEYIANIVYAFVLCRMGRRWLLLLISVSAILLCRVAYSAHSLIGGWDGNSFWDGGARIFYSFLAGMIVYRFRFIIKNKVGFSGLAVLLFLAFIMPFNIKWNWITELLVVMFYFPLIVALGAGATMTPGVKKICLLSGQISYPLYMTHYAALWAFANYYAIHKPGNMQLAFIVIASLIVLTGIAYLAMLAYDIPVRRYLTGRRSNHPN